MTMGFYYFSPLSVVPLGIAYSILACVLIWLAHLTHGAPGRKVVMLIVGVVFLVMPIAEEFWIAWTFGKACRNAGTFAYKVVQVDGFFDASRTVSSAENVGAKGYRFIERPASDKRGFERIERADDQKTARTRIRYAEQRAIAGSPKINARTYRLNEREKLVVSPDGGNVWLITTLDRPSAKYYYKYEDYHLEIGHKITRVSTVVVDAVSNEVIGRYSRIARTGPWFVPFGSYNYYCDAPGNWPKADGDLRIYKAVLRPIQN